MPPPPKPNGQRRRRNAPKANTVKLPATGRQDPPPPWPIDGANEPESWSEIWRTPQAVMWEKQGAEMVVARYLLLRDEVSRPTSDLAGVASFWGQLNNLEDRLGLTPMAMMKLQWEIAGTADVEDDAQEPEGDTVDAHIIDLQKRAGFGK